MFLSRPLWLISLFLFLSISLNAQSSDKPDHIKLRSGETIEGEVLIYSGKKKYEAITLISEGRQTDYLPSQVEYAEYGNNQRIEVNEKSGKFWFALVKGDMSLYKNAIAYYIVNEANEVIELNDKVKEKSIDGAKVRKKNISWRNTLADAVKTCLDKYALVLFVQYRDDDISEYVNSYNECQKSSSKVYISDSNKFASRIGLTIGGFQYNPSAQVNFQPLFEPAESSSQILEFGITSEIFFRNSQERISFTPELILRNVSTVMTADALITPTNRITFQDVYYTSTLIALPLGLKYNLSRNYPRVYIKVMAIPEYSLSTELEVFEEREDFDNEISVSRGRIDIIPEYFLGIGGSLGCQFKLGNVKANLEAQFQRSHSIQEDATYNITSNRIGLSLKIYLL